MGSEICLQLCAESQIAIWRAVPADNGAPGVHGIRDSWVSPGNDTCVFR